MFEAAKQDEPISKRYIVAIVDLDRVVTKRSLSDGQVDIFLWLAQESFADAARFAALHGERPSELSLGKAIRFRLFDKLAAKRFAIALRRRRRLG